MHTNPFQRTGHHCGVGERGQPDRRRERDEGRHQRQEVRQLGADEGLRLVALLSRRDLLKNKDFLFINVHIPYAGEIEKTDLFLPYDQAAQQIDKLPVNKNAKIVVYCRSDRMSRISVNEWVKAGYTNLYNLDGGFEAWVAAGYKLLNK